MAMRGAAIKPASTIFDIFTTIYPLRFGFRSLGTPVCPRMAEYGESGRLPGYFDHNIDIAMSVKSDKSPQLFGISDLKAHALAVEPFLYLW